MLHHVTPVTMNRLIRRAGELGAVFTPPIWRLRLSDCEAPKEVSYTSYARLGERQRANGAGQGAMMIILASCRRCKACLRRRQRLWTARAIEEGRSAARSWFLTLTMRPEEHAKNIAVADLRLRRKGLPGIDALDDVQRWTALAQAGSPEMTRFLKRVRANSGERFRYLLVSEPHKSGMPHWHALLHEVAGPIRKRVIREAWHVGFSQARLVGDGREAAYVAKYLAKGAGARVRASQAYGRMQTSSQT